MAVRRANHYTKQVVYLLLLLLFVIHDGHVLQLSSMTVVVRRRIYDGHMIPGDEYGPNFLTFVLLLRENPGKKPQPGSWPDQVSNPDPLREK